MDMFAAETALAEWVAQKVSLPFNRRVFPGDLPSSLAEGIGVAFSQGLSKGPDRLNEMEAIVEFFFSDRTELENHLRMLLEALPAYASGNFAEISLGSHLKISRFHRREIPVHRVAVPLKVAFV